MAKRNSGAALRLLLQFRSKQFSETARVVSGLGQKPVTECRDLWLRRSCLGTDDPIRLEQFQTQIERPGEPAVDKVPRCKRRACKRNALAVDGRIYQHACAVQGQAVRYFGVGNTGSIEPLRPGFAVVQMQQRSF